LHEYSKIREKLSALDEEIETDKNVELLKEIIKSAKKEPIQENVYRVVSRNRTT